MRTVQGIPIRTEPPSVTIPDVANSFPKHPEYNRQDWDKWRVCYNAGQEFVDEFLKKFSKRESDEDFRKRKLISPTPVFATAAINDVKNAIFQRTADITRAGGSTSYQQAIKGMFGGVDLSGSTMNWFVGSRIIPELLVMSKVGVYVDMPAALPATNLPNPEIHPYLYHYTRENIYNWAFNSRRELTAIHLGDTVDTVDEITGLPTGTERQNRILHINDEGTVTVRQFKENGEQINQAVLNIPKIPFVMFGLSDSLMKYVCNHQIALLNLESSDLGFVLKANFPLYTEQVDRNRRRSHLTEDTEEEPTVEVGTTDGRFYAPNMDRPDFVAPPTEPLEASMKKQANLKDDIRQLINLALSTIKPTMASAESKQLDQQGLESGLSYIGLELEHGESKIAEIWSLYERSKTVATVSYPRRYSLKSDKDRHDEAEQLASNQLKIPSMTFQKAISKQMANLFVADKVSASDLEAIYREIDKSPLATSDPDILLPIVEAGILSKKLVAEASNYPQEDLKLAEKEHAERLARIQAAQTDPGARGIADASINPDASSQEKIGKPKRGSE